MKVVALTGGVACGKTTVADHLAGKGFPIIDTDQIARMVLSNDPCAQESVTSAFGTLDRRELRGIIFDDPGRRSELEQILHPPILVEVNHRLDQLRRQKPEPKVAVVMIPLLFETDGQERYDEVLAVVCSNKEQIARLQKRDQISAELAEKMVDSQLPNEEKVKKSHHVLENDGNLTELLKDVDQLIPKLLS